MKAKLQKNKRDTHILVPVIGVLVVMAAFALYVIFSDTKDWATLLPLVSLLMVIKIYYDPYYVTDNNQLIGNGVVVVPFIQRIERKAGGGLRVFYVRMEGGEVRSRSYYPADEQHFIDNLLEINPNIKLN